MKSFLIGIYIFLLGSSVIAQVNLTNGLVGHYTFSGNGNDQSGNNYHASLVNGITLSNDRFGTPNSAYKFDGINDYISIGDNGAFSTPFFSMSMWFKTETSNLQCLLGKRDFGNTTGSGGAQYQVAINYPPFPGVVSNLVGNNNTCTSISSSSYLNSNIWLCPERWYNLTVTYNGQRHKIFIDGVLKVDSPTPFGGFLQCNSEIRLGNWWQSDPLWFKGTIDDLRWYNRALNDSEVASIFDNFVSPTFADFNYTQNICNPLSFQFSSNNPSYTSYSWNLGNNTSGVGPTQNVTYSSYGTYQVKLRVTTSYGCIDSVSKTVVINSQIDSLINRNDTAICVGDSIILQTRDVLNFCWNNTTGLINGTLSNPTATPLISTTYGFTGQVAGFNLVTNGNFSAGNTGFTSSYVNQITNTSSGAFAVGNNPAAWNNSFTACTDHTGSNGNMLMINGNSIVGASVWSQSVTVIPNTNYVFGAWVQSLSTTNTGSLRFSVNGNTFPTVVNAPSTTCNWIRYFATWNSGSNTSANIAILNFSNSVTGNDYAIDDIVFAPVQMLSDSIRITVNNKPIPVVSNDVAICPGDSIQLNGSGGTSQTWLPNIGLSNNTITNPTAFPTNTTTYIFTTTQNGCSASDSVEVFVKSAPNLLPLRDTAFCGNNSVQLSAISTDATAYSWTPTNGLSNALISNPIASPTVTTNYILTLTNNQACTKKDTLAVQVLSEPIFQTITDTSICANTGIVLQTTAQGNYVYNWSPSTGLNNPTNASPTANPITSTQYIVTASNGGCSSSDTVQININPSPTLSVGNDTTICIGGSASLFANTNTGNNINWSPSTGLNNPSSLQPLASPSSSTMYYITSTNNNLCVSRDSVLITVSQRPVFTLNPLNPAACLGKSIQFTASGGDNYIWQTSGTVAGQGSPNATITATNTTPVKVIIYDNECKLTDSITTPLTINALPNATVSKSNDIDCSLSSVTLQATGGASYSWTPTTGLSNATIASPIATPTSTTSYLVNVTDNNGCTDTASIIVQVNNASGNSGFLVPSAFTPNNDGKNDCFGLKYWNGVTELEFSVFNRWGERIFYTNDVNRCWDGKYKGLPQDTGTYVYMVKATALCGPVFRKGTVVLIR